MKIQRNQHISRIIEAMNQSPVVAIIGARQVGKTTITYDIEEKFKGIVHRFDLEDPDDLALFDEPKLTLKDKEGLIIIDEIQRKPDLFPLLRVLVDRPSNSTQFLILGSASPNLLKQSSESLAGRITYYKLQGFNSNELKSSEVEKLWMRGGFPRSFLADSNKASWAWRRGFILTFLERDIPQLGFNIPAMTLHRFWSMLAHYHGQIWNGSELARAFGMSHSTIKRYVDLLTDTLIVWQLKPWYQNLSKRQVKSTKVYLDDSGLLHSLLSIQTPHDLEKHPKVGASWEGFVIKEIIQYLGMESDECYFWGTHSGAGLDLLIFQNGNPIGFEIKRTTSPKITSSMKSSMKDLMLKKLFVIHAGEHEFKLHENITAFPMKNIQSIFDAVNS